MSTTTKRVNSRVAMSSTIPESFSPIFDSKYLIEKLKEIGGNSFSFSEIYMNHLKYFLSSNMCYHELSVPEALYIFKNDLKNKPRCFCGNYVKFQGDRYAKTCSRKCNNNSEEANKKRKETNLKKYGYETIFKSEIVKSKIKQKKMENNTFSSYFYNVKAPLPKSFKASLSCEDLKQILLKGGGSYVHKKQELMDHVKYFLSCKNIPIEQLNSASEMFFLFKNELNHIPTCTCGNRVKFHQSISRYSKFCGSYCFSNDKDTKSKIEKTCLEKYGVLNFSQTNNFKEENSKKQLIENYEDMVKPFSSLIIPNFTKNDYKGKNNKLVYNWKCLRCSCDFESSFTSSNLNRPRCLNCDSHYSDMELIVKDILSKNNITFEYKNRKILNENKEIDFYVPSHKTGIEVNGLFYHSEKFTNAHYHLNKTKEAELQQKKLIHVFTDELIYKHKIVTSRIKNILNGIKYRIYARKCIIKEIDAKTSQKFLEKYHIQGNAKDKIRLGLFYKNRLLSVMTFSLPRNVVGYKTKTKNTYELVRFCGTFNIKVVGGASKLLSYFEKTYNPESVISYADRRWSSGSLYFSLGFQKTKETNPNYWYTSDFKRRIHRFHFQKHLLHKKLKNYDPNKTEHQNMLNNGYFRVYDCGSLKFEKNYCS